MSSTAVAKPNQSPKETLDIFFHLKALILSNAQFNQGRSVGGRPRTYDIVTTSRVRGQPQYKVLLVGFEENHKATGKCDVDSKVLARSAVKLNLNQAMEDLLKKTQEESWRD
ncbi:hypothetical protein PMIN06_009931 [Paraphaeosphaeria minitans]